MNTLAAVRRIDSGLRVGSRELGGEAEDQVEPRRDLDNREEVGVGGEARGLSSPGQCCCPGHGGLRPHDTGPVGPRVLTQPRTVSFSPLRQTHSNGPGWGGGNGSCLSSKATAKTQESLEFEVPSPVGTLHLTHSSAGSYSTARWSCHLTCLGHVILPVLGAKFMAAAPQHPVYEVS